jgi:hypothetical protein
VTLSTIRNREVSAAVDMSSIIPSDAVAAGGAASIGAANDLRQKVQQKQAKLTLA